MVKTIICPKCKSTDVKEEDNKGMFAIGGVNPIFTCRNCGYSGIIFPETEEEYMEEYEEK